MNFPIGIIVDCFRTDIKEGVKKAAALGAKGIQVYVTSGAMAPENMSAQDRKEFLSFVRDNGLKVSALCGDMGAPGFTDRALNPQRIERSKRMLDLALDLDTDVVTTHIGVIPSDSSCEQYQVMQEACFALSQYADSIHAHFAIETGPEPADILRGFLDTLNSKGVAVNLDPANLVMVTGDDPVKAVYTLQDYIVHTHAKDGRMLRKNDAHALYDSIEDQIQMGHSFIELPLGEGDVDFPRYLKALEEIGYSGFLTIEREVGENPQADIKMAIDFLTRTMDACRK